MSQPSAQRVANEVANQELSEREFAQFCQLVRQATGIQLGNGKQTMLQRRLASRLQDLALPDFAAYLAYLEQGHLDELQLFINAVTTNLTAFFRETHHFEHLAKQLAGRAHLPGHDRLRIWSAACSSGEEPYSIALTLLGTPGACATDTRILATDIDSAMVARAASGVYPASDIEKLGRPELHRWFQRSTSDGGSQIRMRREVRSLISFKRLNLLERWPMCGPFDAVFCRNVMIYFDKDTQRTLVDRIADLLRPNGLLYIGHSESLFSVSDRFELLGKTAYRRIL